MIELDGTIWWMFLIIFGLSLFGAIMNVLSPNREIKRFIKLNRFPVSDNVIRATGILGLAFYGFVLLFLLGDFI